MDIEKLEIDFTPLTAEHIPLLREWLKRPHVAEFWQEPEGETEFRDKYLSKLQERSVKPFIILVDGRPVGFIQSYEDSKVGGGWWSEEKAGVHGIDQFIGEAQLIGKGIGTNVIGCFVQALFSDHCVTEIITDPDPSNGRAIRAYENVGFRREGEITSPGGAALLLRLSREQFLLCALNGAK
jgi:aminoglycoside 6'-N-acetyltransferase